ncbi:DMT family transporter [Desulfocurvus sp. DL9XJH121]
MARGYLLILLAAVLWGSLGPVARYAFSQGVTPLEVAFWRCTIPFVPFCVQALRRGPLRVEPGDRAAMLGFAMVCVVAFYSVYQLAIHSGGAALASVLMYTAPAWVALLAWAILGEAMTPAKLGAVAMTLAGVAGVSGIFESGAPVSTSSLILGLLSGLTYAAYYIFGKRLQPRYSTPLLFMYSLPLGALVLFPFVEFHPKTAGAWAAIAAVALFSTWGAYIAYFAGLRQVEATRASVVATVEPLVAAVMAFAWWGERFTPMGYAGSLLILGAVCLIVFDGVRQGRSVPSRVVENTEPSRIP